jgi:anti-sigma regulatory factor (Ser/Thr protein kinase)
VAYSVNAELENKPMTPIAEKNWEIPNQMTALAEVAKEAFDWLASLPYSTRAKYSAGLAIEEMASNIIKYAYEDDREHRLRIRIVAERSRLRIIFEDDGRPFDPTRHPAPNIEHIVNSHRAGGLGIELVRRISESMTYERVDGLNRLTVQIRRLEPHDTQVIALN